MSNYIAVRLGPLTLRDVKLLTHLFEDRGIVKFEVEEADPGEGFYRNSKPGDFETYQANNNLVLLVFTDRIKDLNEIIVPLGLSPIPEDYRTNNGDSYSSEHGSRKSSAINIEVKKEHHRALQSQSELDVPHHQIYFCPKGDFQSDVPRLCPKHQIRLVTLKEGERPMSPLRKIVFLILGALGAAQMISEFLKIFDK